jgi:hypothetical protein
MDRGHVVVCAPIEQAATGLARSAAPLFEEEGHSRNLAVLTYPTNPVSLHRPRPRPTLSTNDHPLDTIQIDSEVHGFQQRLNGEEPYSGWHSKIRRLAQY